MGKPFARANALMAAVAMAVMNSAAVTGFAEVMKARELAAGYVSRGHGGKRAHRMTGITRVRRQALKTRNVKANRRAHR